MSKKHLPLQVLFATLTHDDQIKLKPVQYLVKRETALPSLKDDCHLCLALSGNHQFPFRIEEEVEKKVVKSLESFCSMLCSQSKFQLKKPITKYAKTLIKLCFSNTDNEDPVGRRKSRNNIPYRTDLVLVHEVDYEEKTTTSRINTLCTSEISNDSEGEKLQLKTIHQTNLSVMEQSLNNSSYDPSFFKNISGFKLFVLLLLLH